MEALDKKMKKKLRSVEEMSKEQIREAIQKKRECNVKAQSIVESLLENQVTEEYFMECLVDINQSHLEDIIEERSIIQLCGYPLCSKTLSVKDIPKQKYRISMKTNKVYDITIRKCFCSNACYEGAMHVKKQMFTSPLWFREYEVVPTFHLLRQGSGSIMGQEVDVAIIERITKTANTQQFTTVNDFTSASLTEISDNKNADAIILVNSQDTSQNQNENIEFEIKEKTHSNDSGNNKIENKTHTEPNDSQKNKPPPVSADTEGTQESTSVPKHKVAKSNPFNIVGEIVEKPEKKIDPILTEIPENKSALPIKSQKNQLKLQPTVAMITIEVEKCLADWITLDTMLFLLGEVRVKEMIADKGVCIKEYLNNYAKSIFYNSNTYDQYQALCRKLNMLELEDKKFDSQALQRETKPLPDYCILQEESKKLQLKVNAFFAGETEIPKVGSSQGQTGTVDEDSMLTKLPLVDKNAQNALRRRIVCNHLNKVLPDILRSLGLLTLSISEDVRLLVNTFKLKANNIMFKPIQWTLIAIIIIRLLSLKDPRLQHLLEQQKAFQHLQLLLLMYKRDDKYLDRLISWLTDIDRLLNTNDTQLTLDV